MISSMLSSPPFSAVSPGAYLEVKATGDQMKGTATFNESGIFSMFEHCWKHLDI